MVGDALKAENILQLCICVVGKEMVEINQTHIQNQNENKKLKLGSKPD